MNFKLIFPSLLISLLAISVFSDKSSYNIALNKKYTCTQFHPGNRYGNCADENDIIQLTDGHTSLNQTGEPFLWFRKSSVAWRAKPWITIEIDLEKTSRVNQVTYVTSAGIHGFFWPKNIYVLTSLDGKTYQLITDMIQDNKPTLPEYGKPTIEEPINYKIKSRNFSANARYIKLVINQVAYIHVADEIEVLGNPDASVSDETDFLKVTGEGKELFTKLKYSTRIFSEAEQMKNECQLLGIDSAGRFDNVSKMLSDLCSSQLDYKTFSTIVPNTEIDFELLRINAEILNKKGNQGIITWLDTKWNPVDVYSVPEKTDTEKKLFLANGEQRGQVINITNCESFDKNVKVSIQLPEKIKKSDFVYLRKVLCNDNQMNCLVYNILDDPFESIQENNLYIPSGMTQQLWIDFKPKTLKTGTYNIPVIITDDKNSTKINFEINISRHPFPKKLTLDLGMWDYITSATKKRYNLTKDQIKTLLNIMKEFKYNRPWIPGSYLPNLDDSFFDNKDELIVKPDFTEIDNWIDTFDFADNYYIAGLRTVFGTVSFSKQPKRYFKRVEELANAFNKYLLQKDIKQSVYIIPVDEPHTADQQIRSVKTALAIKKGTENQKSKIKIFVDTVHGYPKTEADVIDGETIYSVSDDICAHYQIFLNFLEKSQAQDFYKNMIDQKKEFSFYNTLTPARSFDPYYYYLLQQWVCYKYKATGSGYWQFYDLPEDSNFNDYAIEKLIYSPFYSNNKKTYITKHWKAIYEGRQDYEYLVMLKERIKNEKSVAKSEQFEKLLYDVLNKTVQPLIDYTSKELSLWDANPEIYTTHLHWKTKKDRSVSEKQRKRIWQVLNKDPKHKGTCENGFFDITKFGAVADDELFDSNAINRAITKCSKSGGGVVKIPDGRFLCKPIQLKSNVELNLAENAVLFFSDTFTHYPIRPVRHEGIEIVGYSALIYADNAKNIAITGKGEINGNGKKWWHLYRDFKRKFKNNQPLEPINEHHKKILNGNKNKPHRSVGWFFPRPMLIDLRNCQNVIIQDITIKDSPFWMVHPTYCENVLISGIKTSANGPNTDGVDPDSSKNVIIENCVFYNGDDCIAIKSGYNEDGLRINIPTENVIVRNCTMNFSDASSVAIGSETSGGIRNVLIENCLLKNADRAIRIKTARGRGGVVEAVRINNLKIENMRKKVFEITGMYDSSTPQQVNAGTPHIRDIRISNIQCRSPEADWFCEITGLVEKPFENFMFHNIEASAKSAISCTDVKDAVLKCVRLETSKQLKPRLTRTSGFKWTEK